ncbi:hypothetical protein [Vagococcus salmoninarum]|uniref:hypothetical protein n=2 Tax=Vagococcus salmoninarum TaxID=2739 RepID=UPI003F9AF2D8
MKKKLLGILTVSLTALFLVACNDSSTSDTEKEKESTTEKTITKESEDYSEADLAEFTDSINRLLDGSEGLVDSITTDVSGDWSKGIDVTVSNDVRDFSEDEKMEIANKYGLAMAGKVRGLLYGADPDIKPFVTVYYQNEDVMARHDVLKEKMVLEN